MTPQLVPILAWAGGTLIASGLGLLVYEAVFGWRRRRDLSRLAALAPKVPLDAEPAEPSGAAGRIDRAFERLVARSGVRIGSATAFLLIVLAAAAAAGAVLAAFDHVPGAILAALAAAMLSLGYFVYRKHRLELQLAEQLPRAIDILVRAMRAGRSVDDALRLVGSSAQEPMAAEFRRCAAQLDLGLSMAAAMRGIAGRVPVADVRMLAFALAVQRQAGGNLPLVLERVAAVMRDRQSYYRQYRAATAGGRFGALLIGLAVPAYLAFVLFYQADYGGVLLTDPLGPWVLAGALTLLAVGLLWVVRSMKPRY